MYDDLFTNVCAEHFEYYFLAIDDSELVYNPQYDKKSVFLGMGFNRLTDDSYKLERDIFFSEQNDVISIYGNGWNNHKNWVEMLPPNNIGSLYKSAKSAVAIIGKGQRELGMINNRYSEIAFSKSPSEYHKVASDIYRNPDKYHYKCNLFRDFIVKQDNIFYEKLTRLFYV
jgi:hypothetical protein